jgi:hypothetical protein
MSSNINQIIFENINNEYSYGMYSNFIVIIHTESGYINITKLCKLKYNNLEDKNLCHWLENKENKDLIKYINENKLHKNSKFEATFLKKAGGKNETLALVSGTYAHPLIVPQVAQWISVKFALMVSEIINQHLVDEYLLKLDEKDGEIESLNVTIKRMEKKLDTVTNELKLTRNELGDANSELKEIKYELYDANDNIEALADELLKKDKSINTKNKVIDIATDQRVPSTKSITKTENFIVMKYKNKDKNDNSGHRYRIVAGLRNYANSACERLVDNDFKEILRLEDVNNSKNVLHRLKEQHKKSKLLDFSGSRFSIVDKKISQTNLIKMIKELFEERKNVDTSDNSDSE